MNNHKAKRAAFLRDAILQADSGKALSPDLKLNCKSLFNPGLALACFSFYVYVTEDTRVLQKPEQVDKQNGRECIGENGSSESLKVCTVVFE